MLLSGIKNLIFDFIFPKPEKTLELEALSVSDILNILPRSENLKDKDVLALFDYKNDLTKQTIWQIKYKGNEIISGKFADILYDVLRHEITEMALFDSNAWQNRPILLMPIPMSEERRHERGWNQAEILAEKIFRLDKGELFQYLPNQLLKIRHTESQTQTRSKKEREKNLINSMKVLDEPAVCDKCAIVVDDVVTTGSTFAEAKRVLRKAGAKKVLCIAVAH